MFCSRCGSEITGKSKFCPSCGLDLMATTPVHAIATGALQEMDLVREALAAEYEILEELGRGGMALVYRARDRQLEREVAIKVLPFSLAFDAEFVERFQREARTAAQLEHPNIISIYRVGRAGRVIYFVMKYLRGGALSGVLTERGKLAPPEIRRLLVEAGSALGYAAQRGIVHRDIKPDNIMFDEFGQCLLTDFGIAKAASGQRLTGTGMSIGTPHYMSPEQARAQGIDGRSDLYSLGVVAYQCLTGAVPYDGEDSFSIGYKHITEPVPVPALVTADERRLFEVIKRMLMKEPEERFQNGEELLAALEGQPIAAVGSIRAGVGAGVGMARASLHVAPAAAGPALPALNSGAVAAGSATLPPIVSQPTTPLTSPLVDRRVTAPERRDRPARRLADRSVAMRSGGGSWAWFWVVVAILGGVGAGVYYYKSRGFVQGGIADSTSSRPADSAAAVGSPDGAAGPTGPADTAAPRNPAAASPDSASAAPASGTPSSADSGGVRVIGLPQGSTVMIDERQVTDSVTKLAPGQHVLAISAPRHNFYVDTILVRAGEIDDLSPQLTPLGAPTPLARPRGRPLQRLREMRRERRQGPANPDSGAAAAPAGGDPSPTVARCTPGPGYNPDHSCFDERPKPVNAPFVAVPADTQASPTPSLLWVKVSAEGRTVDMLHLRPSSDSAFEREVRNFAWTMTWHPALKNGAPVEAWTQMQFPPQR